MPHLHLPADHSDSDVVLAASLADIVGSEDLYVAWTHETGAGAVPEVDAMLRERPRARRGVLGRVAAALGTFWARLMHGPAPLSPAAVAAATSPRAGEPSA